MKIIRLADAAVVQCAGRISYGPEAKRLQKTVARVLGKFNECVLNLAAVTQVDASGLGTLVELARQPAHEALL